MENDSVECMFEQENLLKPTVAIHKLDKESDSQKQPALRASSAGEPAMTTF